MHTFMNVSNTVALGSDYRKKNDEKVSTGMMLNVITTVMTSFILYIYIHETISRDVIHLIVD